MAARLGLTPESYKNEVKQTALNIEHEWKRAKSKPNWRAPQSSLQIDVVDAVATHSVARVDGRVCLIAEPILGTSGSQETMVFEFRDMAGTSAPLKWLVDGLQDIEERCGTPLFTDVQSGGQP
jgi:hypothetical protein